MYFRDPKKELPEIYKTVFVKLKDDKYCFAFYSPTGKWYPDDDVDVVFSIDIMGWVPISELNSIEIK